MKITILPFEKKHVALDAIMLYNLIKRWEENLKSGNPLLKDFNLEIKLHPSYTKYNASPNASYTMEEDGSMVHLKVSSHPGQEPSRVYHVVKEQLAAIRNDQYNL